MLAGIYKTTDMSFFKELFGTKDSPTPETIKVTADNKTTTMKKYILLFLAIVLTTIFSGQTNHHKKKHHDKKAVQTIPKVDSTKIVADTVSTVTTSASADTKDEGINLLWIIGGSALALILIIGFASSKAAKKKRLEEDAYVAKLKADLTTSLQNKEIYEEHYKELNALISFSNKDRYLESLDDAKTRKRRHDYLRSKYSEREVQKIRNHEYWIGMTEEQLIDAKGQPDKIDLEQLKTKTKKIYIYGNKSSGDIFNFVDGVLERFKDR